KETIEAQTKLFHDRILPTLDNNIKSGNSLIDLDYYDNELDFGEERKIKPFSWKKAFPEVFNNGGFDCIVGNPPYVSVKEILADFKNYFLKTYNVAKGQFDLYTLFIERSFEILNNNGVFGMITSNTFLANKDCLEVRKLLIQNYQINEIVNLGETVFKDANLDVAVLIANKQKSKEKAKIIVNDVDFKDNNFHLVNPNNWKRKDDFSITINIKENEYKLLDKIFGNGEPLKNLIDLPRGIEVGSNSELICNTQQKGYLPVLFGKNIKQYQIIFNNQFIKFDFKNKSTFKDIAIYEQDKILIQRIRNLSLKQRIVATIDKENFVCTNTLRIGIPKKKTISLKYVLAILNSKLINWIFLKEFMNKDIYAYQLEQIPIAKTNDKQQNEIIKLVEQLLKLNTDKQNTTLPNQLEMINNKIEYAENKINEIVYQLYELTEEEIKLIEHK
ncbi:MAG: Eco57I restriction-modification methylase domain-containing protein, partial [Bacteroidetes bacterium]|nr:Eco57I restriction-modification methylase domain-containing protein [Bacteroidota bacterium]